MFALAKFCNSFEIDAGLICFEAIRDYISNILNKAVFMIVLRFAVCSVEIVAYRGNMKAIAAYLLIADLLVCE